MSAVVAGYPKTGIRIVVVGAGFGGLTTAIECTLKGHSVTVLEKAPKWEQLGDIISINPNAGKIISRWDRTKVNDRLDKICMNHSHFRIHQHTGEHVLDQPAVPRNTDRPMYNGHRADMHRVFYEYALSLGIPIHLGTRVVSYHEDPAKGEAWVITGDGKEYRGNVVVGADGVRSRARKLVLGVDDKPQSSGYAVYRAWFDVAEAGIDKDPLTKEFVEHGKDIHAGWLGPDVHLLVATCKGGKEISWVCTHRDDADIDESWSFPGKVDEVLEIIKGWDPRVRQIIAKTPSCVDWKLMHRAPLPTWITKGGHMCLLGDAAHPFLPTSIQGCSQAIEDGCALATALALSHSDSRIATSAKVPTALRLYERLRYERVKTAQRKGEAVRDMWHKVDWSTVKENPEQIKIPRETWLVFHDCERYIHRLWDRAVDEMNGGPEIEHKSLCAGPDSDEAEFDTMSLPPSPAETPKEELERRLA